MKDILRKKLIPMCDDHFWSLACIQNIYYHKSSLYHENFNNRSEECMCGYGSWPDNKCLPHLSCQIENYDKDINGAFGIKLYSVKCSAVKVKSWTSIIKKLYPTKPISEITLDHSRKQLIFISKLVPPLLSKIKRFDELESQTIFDNLMTSYIDSYLNFTDIYKNNKTIYPSMNVSFVWQAHMMNKEVYRDDTKELFGEIVDFKYPEIIQL